jgi:hypothetical protein
MKARIETGTDIAMLGAWDRSRNEKPLEKQWGKEFDQFLEADANAGEVFVIHTGADCGGPVDVLIDEQIPQEFRDQMSVLPGEFLLRVPSGRLVVGGIEDYRSAKPKITDSNTSEAQIPAGDYGVQAYIGPEENIPVTPSKAELKRLLGEEDFRYYNRVEKQGCLGYLTLLLFPVLWPVIGWMFAAGLTALVVIGFFYVREELFLRRNERYRRINTAVNDAYVKAGAKSTPIFVFRLRRVEPMHGLEGGSIDLNIVRPPVEKT